MGYEDVHDKTLHLLTPLPKFVKSCISIKSLKTVSEAAFLHSKLKEFQTATQRLKNKLSERLQIDRLYISRLLS